MVFCEKKENQPGQLTVQTAILDFGTRHKCSSHTSHVITQNVKTTCTWGARFDQINNFDCLIKDIFKCKWIFFLTESARPWRTRPQDSVAALTEAALRHLQFDAPSEQKSTRQKKINNIWHYYETIWPSGYLKRSWDSQGSMYFTLGTAATTSACSAYLKRSPIGFI